MKELRRKLSATSAKTTLTLTMEMDRAFNQWKTDIATAPVLALQDFEKLFIVEIDASSVTVCSVISEALVDKNPTTICFASRTITPAERTYSTGEKENFSVILAFPNTGYILFLQRHLLQLQTGSP